MPRAREHDAPSPANDAASNNANFAVEDADILDDYASDLRILGVNRLHSCTAEDEYRR